jgi:Lhr-like helicase
MSTKPGPAFCAMRFGEFRPLQKEINSTALEEKDVLVLLPTGGGKSLRPGFRHCP